ncbi:transglutaminase-like domain-containing protein [Methylobacterium planeticum]|uniref:Transglutaminase family protein n=1 Tax=Methylobacterium planeticum TaxID=2615211 RepID=A0A6N6MW60_9HYPH|nr:transglutaminase family protein [Methylobacterium planeticum]KAB1074029.1 transglutaminase family protein [Methylobacterium planeticum]
MLIRTGYSIAFDTLGPIPMNLMLSVHPSRTGDLVTPDTISIDPPVPTSQYLDDFGNVCTRLVAPGGRITMSADFTIQDTGRSDDIAPEAKQIPVQDLPDGVLVFLLGSRYCDTDKLSETAWSLFGTTPEGWARVQSIVDFVHERITFNYQEADATRTAFDGYHQQRGVCRDFAHLAVTFCRCMNIPARYCTGYLGDIGIASVPDPMDFSAWFEVYLDGPDGPRWYTFDARHNKPRIGRIVMAHGRDATDVAISTSFGSALLAKFEVHTDEVPSSPTEDFAKAA